jgi:cobyrinic acid a,c-diamide synthase
MVQRFLPLADRCHPPGLDALYFGGGYPEVHAEALSANMEGKKLLIAQIIYGAGLRLVEVVEV